MVGSSEGEASDMDMSSDGWDSDTNKNAKKIGPQMISGSSADVNPRTNAKAKTNIKKKDDME